MADADRILKILLQLQADTADSSKVTGALKDIETQAAQTAAAVRGTGEVVPIDRGSMAAQLAAEADIKAKMLATETQSAAVNAATEAMMERRVIVETQLEAAEARIAGNPALAARLEREAEIRLRALTVQRTLNVTTEESIALAERLVLAQEASVAPAAAMGVNLGKARAEAMVLGRELAAGNVRASTMSSLLGSLGTTFTIAGIAAYELYHGIASAYEGSQKMDQEVVKLAEEITKAKSEFAEMARESQTLADTVKLGDRWALELARVEVKMAEFRAHQLGFWASFVDKIVNMFASAMNSMFSKIPGLDGIVLDTRGPFLRAAEKDIADAHAQAKEALKAANDAITISLQSDAKWANARAHLSEGIKEYTAEVSTLEAKLAGINRNGSDREFDEWVKTANQLTIAKDRLGELQKEQDKLNKKTREGHEAHRETAAILRDESALLAGIRQQQELVSGNPLLSADAKEEKLHNLYLKEQADILAQMEGFGRRFLSWKPQGKRATKAKFKSSRRSSMI
jgi:hypothetical protein